MRTALIGTSNTPAPPGRCRDRTQSRRAGKLSKLAKEEATGVVDTVYRVTYEGGNDSPPFARAFIASFCSHLRSEEPYEQRNGLLSQWRAYGKSERYAIVFDLGIPNLSRRQRVRAS